MDIEAKNYEIAYLLPSSIPEEEVLTHAGKISSLIEEMRGAIKRVEEPKKRRLSYQVKNQQNAYFGWTTFRMIPEFLVNLNKKIRNSSDILRYLIVEEEEIPVSIRPLRTIPRESRAPLTQAPAAEHAPEEEKLDLEALDKKLEEILGK